MNSSKSRVYPSQMGLYRVKVKNGAIWHDFDVARLQISVGMPYHESEKFLATLDWARERFEKIIICVNDTLQRFNYQFLNGLTESDAFSFSLLEGDKWIERNCGDIKSYRNVSLVRWEDWRNNEMYHCNLELTRELYINNTEFKSAIDNNIQEVWNRKFRHKTGFYGSYEEFIKISKDYLIEETAVFSMMFEQDCAVDVYPGTPLLPVTLFRGKQLKGAPVGMGKGTFTRIDFLKVPPVEIGKAA